MSLINTMILKVPYYHQTNDYNCGPASLQMVLEYHGIILSQKELSTITESTYDNGTLHIKLINTAREKGFYTFVNEGSNIEEIKYFINQELPIIINYVEPSNNEGHYAVVIGYDNRHVILNDSWNGKDFRIKNDEFIKRWYGYLRTHKYARWIIVLSRNEFNLGRQYYPITRIERVLNKN